MLSFLWCCQSFVTFCRGFSIKTCCIVQPAWHMERIFKWPTLTPKKHCSNLQKCMNWGLIVAARSVFFTLVLLLLITYVFSIAFSQLSENTRLEPKYFPTITSAVLTLIVAWRYLWLLFMGMDPMLFWRRHSKATKAARSGWVDFPAAFH